MSDNLPPVHFLSLGCFRNTVDSEGMLRALVREGFALTDVPEEAGVLVVNTCGFIDLAKQESIDTILELSLLKQRGRAQLIAVVGCLVERYRGELERLLPEVDVFLDLREESSIGRIVKEKLGAAAGAPAAQAPGRMQAAGPARGRDPGRIPLTPPHLAFLKIAEGCSRHCTFCTIPSIRGVFSARDAEEIVREARFLESSGVKELNIISQDTVSYRDEEGRGLVTLVSRLLSGTGIPWIRLLYLHPSGLDEDLMDLLSREERLLGYVDVPIQHAATRILRRMRRGMEKGDIERLVRRLKERVPGLTLRTTVLVGFPGETEEDFTELLAFLEATRFDRLGAFGFSCEEGTPAARLPGQVPEEVKAWRQAEVLDLQRRISHEECRKRVGEVTTVLVDGRTAVDDLSAGADPDPFPQSRPGYIARSRREAYDVDGVVYLAGNFTPSEFTKVRIVDAADYDLLGIPAG
jgi:ribosomal protein S12 methylthiotransferase